MTYSSLLSTEGIKSQFLAIIKPRIVVETFTLVSGTKYTKSFSLGQIIVLTSDGVTKTEATSSALSDGQWYYDVDLSLLYLDLGLVPSTKTIVVTYEIYMGTFDAHWYRIPNLNTSREVYYEPLIKKSPSISLTVSDSLFGFMPSQTSTLVISNATHLLQEHLYASSFLNCDIDLWHWLDSLTTSNISLVFKGLCGNINYSDSDLTISVLDRNKIFKNEYRHALGESFYGSSGFPNCDPNYLNRPIRKVFGYVENTIPVNIDYQATTPAITDNRDWICTNDETNLGSVSTTTPASPACTTTRTYLTSIVGFRVGDSVWIDSISGTGFDGFVYVTTVGANYIEHVAIGTLAAVGSTIKRNFVGNVKIFKDSTVYSAIYGRDYVEYTDATNKVAGFSFNTTLEANLSIASNLNPQDLVYARVYGHKVTSTIAAVPLGSNSTTTNGLTNGVVILYDLLKVYLGLTESEINTTQISTLTSSITDEIGFVLPYSESNDFPTYADILTRISQTLLLKIFQDTNNKWTISQIGPIGTPSKTIEDDEVILGSFSHAFNYSDITSNVIVNYNKKEVSTRNEISNESFSRVTTVSDTAKYLHLVKKQKSFDSFHFIEAQAQTLANHFSYIFGDRLGAVRLSTKNRFFDSLIGDEITVTRTRQLGFPYVSTTTRDLNLSIVSIEKSLNNINIEMTDQKGIEDNTGSW
jgi:hypothetical protein